MNNITNPLGVFPQKAPEVPKAFDQLIEALKSTTGLDAKTKAELNRLFHRTK